MNTTKLITRRHRNLPLGLATIALASVVLVTPPTQASQPVPDKGSTTSEMTFDIAAWVADRKMRWAQDRVDRPWLYQY